MKPNGKISKKSELTPRQWALYRYLTKRGNQWTYQWQIATEVPEYGYGGRAEAVAFHDSSTRSAMTTDIRKINQSSVIQKIIISTPKGVKIATKHEFKDYIHREEVRLLSALKRHYIKARKGAMDKQGKIVFNSERDTVEAFIGD